MGRRPTTRLRKRRPRVNDWLKIIQQWVFPPTCLLCGDSGRWDCDLCAPCHGALPHRASACIKCATVLEHDRGLICGACLKQPPVFDSAFAAFDYEEPVRHLIHALKFGRRYAHSRLLGTLLAERVAERSDLPERLVPVPLHSARYRERGFNQSAEIAREISRRLKIPLDLKSVRRFRATHSQIGLSAAERIHNVKNAFEVLQPLHARRVAIIDDVMTTGSTVAELAKILKSAGVARVEVWVCARADGPCFSS